MQWSLKQVATSTKWPLVREVDSPTLTLSSSTSCTAVRLVLGSLSQHATMTDIKIQTTAINAFVETASVDHSAKTCNLPNLVSFSSSWHQYQIDHATPLHGFIFSAATCGGTIEAGVQEAFITSPGYNEGKYQNYQECTWHIKVYFKDPHLWHLKTWSMLVSSRSKTWMKLKKTFAWATDSSHYTMTISTKNIHENLLCNDPHWIYTLGHEQLMSNLSIFSLKMAIPLSSTSVTPLLSIALKRPVNTGWKSATLEAWKNLVKGTMEQCISEGAEINQKFPQLYSLKNPPLRFCCNELPQGTFKSLSDEIMVLFRSNYHYNASDSQQRGFKLMYNAGMMLELSVHFCHWFCVHFVVCHPVSTDPCDFVTCMSEWWMVKVEARGTCNSYLIRYYCLFSIDNAIKCSSRYLDKVNGWIIWAGH